MACRPRIAPIALLTAAATLAAWTAPAEAQPFQRKSIRLPKAETRPKAHDFPADFTWLNMAQQKLSLAGNLKGHVVVLDFWTYCCINCIHILPDLEYLEHKYAGKPVVVIGVHSAKFETEQDPKNIRQAIDRYRIAHPVLVDQEHQVWRSYGIRAWPTFAVIDSAGRYVGQQSGEGHRELLDRIIQALLDEGKAQGTLAEEPIKLEPTYNIPGPEALAFPGKVLADGAGKRLFIADSNHDRIVVTDLSGKHQATIGNGKRGYKDGSFAEAQFYSPQGMAVAGDTLYVADTSNHAVRKIDLKAKTVTTIAGNGKQAYDRRGGKKGTEQGLSSPWALALDGNRLIIAMAGTHQLWVHDIKAGTTANWVGTGGENIVDGFANEALLAQPSGLAIHDGRLYFADSEVSAVRSVRLNNGIVETLVGKGLFDFGFVDGTGLQAKFQHCLGVAPYQNTLLVADTYNDAIRQIDLATHKVTTLYGAPGKGLLDEPGGLSVADGMVYIADTNQHRIVKLDPKTGKAEALQIVIPVEAKE